MSGEYTEIEGADTVYPGMERSGCDEMVEPEAERNGMEVRWEQRSGGYM